MKKLLFSLFAALTIAASVKAQCFWAKNFGTATGFKTTVDLQGNIYTTGGSASTADFDFGPGVTNLIGTPRFIAKYDGNSNLIWVKRAIAPNAGTGNNAVINSIAVDASGNVILTGYFEGTIDFDGGTGTFNLTALGDQDMFLLKLNNLGNFVWAKKAGGSKTGFISTDVGNDVDVDPAGNIYVVGNIYGASIFVGTNTAVTANAIGAFIAKYDANGNFLWVKLLDGPAGDYGYSIDLDATGNIYTTGRFGSASSGGCDFDPSTGVYNITSAGSYDVFISKLDANGNFLWAKSMGGLDYDEGHSINIDALGNIFVSGYFRSTSSDYDPGAGVCNLASLGGYDIFICKLDASGNFLWAKQFGNTNDDIANFNTIDTDASGNLYITGPFQGVVDFDPGNGVLSLVSAGSNDIYLNKFDSNGNIIYAKQFGSTYNDNVNSIILDGSDNIIVSGNFVNVVDFNPGVGSFNLTSQLLNNPDVFIYKESPIPQPTITSSGSPIICSGNSVTLTSNISSGNTWSNGATTQSIIVNSSGNYYTSVFNGSCTTTSAPFTVTIVQAPSTPTINFNNSNTLCQGDSVILTSSSASGNTWSNGAISQSIVANTSGSYSVSVSNGTCTANSSAVTVSFNPLPIIISQPNNTQTNIGSQAIFTVSSNANSYQWQTNIGSGFQNITNVGQYSGALTNTLVVSNLTMSNNNQQFRCIITFGFCSDVSNIALLTVNNTTGIVDFGNKALLINYPNPVKNQLNIKSDIVYIGTNYRICDYMGRIVLSGHIDKENIEIELSNLPRGIYLLSIGENISQTFKIIKE
jgi:hypothetical protein